MNTKRLREIREQLDGPKYKGPTGRCLSRDVAADMLDAPLEADELAYTGTGDPQFVPHTWTYRGPVPDSVKRGAS